VVAGSALLFLTMFVLKTTTQLLLLILYLATTTGKKGGQTKWTEVLGGAPLSPMIGLHYSISLHNRFHDGESHPGRGQVCKDWQKPEGQRGQDVGNATGEGIRKR